VFMTVSSSSGSLSLDSAVHRIVTHVKRWVAFYFWSDRKLIHGSDFHDEPLVPCEPRIFFVQVGGSTPSFRCFMFVLNWSLRLAFSNLGNSVGAVNEVLRHRDINVDMYPSEQRRCRSVTFRWINTLHLWKI
jgi:hypothetical protein